MSEEKDLSQFNAVFDGAKSRVILEPAYVRYKSEEAAQKYGDRIRLFCDAYNAGERYRIVVNRDSISGAVPRAEIELACLITEQTEQVMLVTMFQQAAGVSLLPGMEVREIQMHDFLKALQDNNCFNGFAGMDFNPRLYQLALLSLGF